MKVQYVLHLLPCTYQGDIRLCSKRFAIKADQICNRCSYLIPQVAVGKAGEQGIFEEFTTHLAVVHSTCGLPAC